MSGGTGEDAGAGDGAPGPGLDLPLRPEVIDRESADEPSAEEEAQSASEAIERPAKVLRIGSMVKQLLDEVRQAPLDEPSRDQLRAIYERSLTELKGALSPDLAEELDRVSVLFDSDTPSEPELRVAQAQLVGWLEGLFHGIQATLVAQQVAARAQLDEMRQRSLPAGPETAVGRPGTYL
ncbi:MAG TPA: proteasome activator [Acidimicrobiales bacterium]|nr:proteasome activator [Acidimicrobiales bacterium]